ncbi:hypothetical protein EB093_08625 [bacterium]|nr:hypothetical protein [bacterium]
MPHRIIPFSHSSSVSPKPESASQPQLTWILGPGSQNLGSSQYRLSNNATAALEVTSYISQNVGSLPDTQFSVEGYQVSGTYSDLYVQCNNPNGDLFAVHYSPSDGQSGPTAYGVASLASGDYVSAQATISTNPPRFGYNATHLDAGGIPFLATPPSFKNSHANCTLSLYQFSESPQFLAGIARVNISQLTASNPSDMPTGVPSQMPTAMSSAHFAEASHSSRSP